MGYEFAVQSASLHYGVRVCSMDYEFAPQSESSYYRIRVRITSRMMYSGVRTVMFLPCITDISLCYKEAWNLVVLRSALTSHAASCAASSS